MPAINEVCFLSNIKGKKAVLSLKALAIIVMSTLVLIGFLMAGKAYGSNDMFFKYAVAKDIAILMGTVYGLPGDAEIYYPVNLFNKYGVKIVDNEVTVFSSNAGQL